MPRLLRHTRRSAFLPANSARGTKYIYFVSAAPTRPCCTIHEVISRNLTALARPLPKPDPLSRIFVLRTLSRDRILYPKLVGFFEALVPRENDILVIFPHVNAVNFVLVEPTIAFPN